MNYTYFLIVKIQIKNNGVKYLSFPNMAIETGGNTCYFRFNAIHPIPIHYPIIPLHRVLKIRIINFLPKQRLEIGWHLHNKIEQRGRCQWQGGNRLILLHWPDPERRSVGIPQNLQALQLPQHRQVRLSILRCLLNGPQSDWFRIHPI